MAFPPHIQLAITMLPHLVERAKAGKRTTYDEMGEAMRTQTRLFSKSLAFIRDDICTRHGLPPLTAIVENKGSDKPINSFAPGELDKLSKADYEKLRQKTLKAVYGYPKWDMALTGLQHMYCAA
ncbi:MAG: hypothetical protein ACHQ50_07305 [Fimbriimonadales bacterium]